METVKATIFPAAMMTVTTTTIRFDTDTHATMLEAAREASEALRRQQFAQHVTNELNALRAEADAWATTSPTPRPAA